jgi:4-amino-4-deoxy-L-arabinose transferase-like glycosyltransferase
MSSSWTEVGARHRFGLMAAGGVVVAAIVVLRILSFGYAMHPDARVYAYIAERLLDGQLLYRDVWEDKAPSFYYLYALVFAVGGASVQALIVARHLLEIVGFALLYELLRRLYGGVIAIVGVSLAALFSSAVSLQRATLMAEHPMLVFVLLALLPLTLAGRRGSRLWPWLAAGCAGGVAVTFKQSAAVILAGPMVVALFAAWRQDRRHRWRLTVWRVCVFGVGMLVPTGLWVAYFWHQGALGQLQAVLAVSGAFVEAMSGQLMGNVVESARFMVEEALLWILAAAWLWTLVRTGAEDRDLFVAAWLLASAASVVAAGAAFPHYYIAVVPALAAAASVLLVRLWSARLRVGTWNALVPSLLGMGLAAFLGLFAVKQVRIYGLVTQAQREEATQARMCETVDRLLERGDTMYEWTGQVTCWRARRPTRFVYFWAFRFIGSERLDKAFGGSWLEEVMRDVERERPRVILVGNQRDRYLGDTGVRPFPALVELLRREYRLAERFTFEPDGHHVDLYLRVKS